MKIRRGKTLANKKLRETSRLENEKIGWLFVLPFIIGFLLYFIPITVNSLKFSLSEITVGTTGYKSNWNNFYNYNYAFRVDTDFVGNLAKTAGQLVMNIPIILIFSILMAIFLNSKLPGRTFFRAVFFIPIVVGTGIVASVDSGNAVQNAMSSMTNIQTGASSSGLSIADAEVFLQSLKFSPTIISYITYAVNNILSVINQSGVEIIIFLAGLQSISPSVYESAQIEGASSWEIFWKITIPMISPMILVNFFYSVISFLTDNSNSVIKQIVKLGYGNSMFGVSSAMAWIYFAVIGVIVALFGFIISRKVVYQE